MLSNRGGGSYPQDCAGSGGPPLVSSLAIVAEKQQFSETLYNSIAIRRNFTNRYGKVGGVPYLVVFEIYVAKHRVF